MKVMKITADGRTELIEIENELRALQQEVGGYIETLTISADCCMIVDEEGVLKGKQLNEKASRLGCPLVGDVLIVGVDGDEFTDVPEPAIEMLKERWDITYDLD